MPTINYKKSTRVLAVIALMAGFTSQSQAFVFLGDEKKPLADNLLTFRLDIPGLSDSGVAWNDAFSDAARDWSMTTAIQINTERGAVDSCVFAPSGDFTGYVGISATLCGDGDKINNRVSGYASVYASDQGITHGNITYNTSADIFWDIYDGPLRGEIIQTSDPLAPRYRTTLDFRRITRHEIGHVLGLGHSVFPRSILSVGSDRARDTDKLSPDDICGVNIANGRLDGCSLLLQSPSSMTGKSTTAIFVGGVSRDRGATHDTVFQSDESIDVMATVVVEDQHFGQQGRLHTVIELSDGTTLMATDDGFAPWDGTVQALKTTAVKALGGANELYILKDFNLAANLISNISVAVYVGYSLDSEPGEVYFSGAPIQFRVE